MELTIVKKEITGTNNPATDSETIVKFELMDGSPM